MKKDEIFACDKSNMFDVLKHFPLQVEEGIKIGETAQVLNPMPKGRHCVFLGMGGSAIGGDLIRSYIMALNSGQDKPEGDSVHRIITVVRNYTLPDFIAHEDLVVASSYSGGTEETLSAFTQAQKRTGNILCISSGGTLSFEARAHSYPLIVIPTGLQPRCALGYSFFPVLVALNNAGYFGKDAAAAIKSGIDETIHILHEKSAMYSDYERGNPALALALRLHGNIPVIYSPAELFDTVGARWRGQMHENAKNLAFANVLPEMCHNEIESWHYPSDFTSKMFVILLRDKHEHSRVELRFDVLKKLLADKTAGIAEIDTDGESALARMFSHIYLGDWVSYYLAILNHTDPTEIPNISRLKQELSAVQN